MVGRTYGLAQRSALSNGYLITLLNTESWRDVRSKVLVSLLVSGILGDEMEIFSADDKCAVHLGGNDGAGQDTATDGDKTSEWAFLICDDWKSACHPPPVFAICPDALRRETAIPTPGRPSPSTIPLPLYIAASSRKSQHTDVVSLNGGLWCSESQSNVLVPSSSTLANSARLRLGLGVEEDVRLLLESTFRLYGEFGGHDCGFVGCRSRKSWREVVALMENRLVLL